MKQFSTGRSMVDAVATKVCKTAIHVICSQVVTIASAHGIIGGFQCTTPAQFEKSTNAACANFLHSKHKNVF